MATKPNTPNTGQPTPERTPLELPRQPNTPSRSEPRATPPQPESPSTRPPQPVGEQVGDTGLNN